MQTKSIKRHRYVWYKDGKVWKQGKDAVNNCYIFNENGTVSLATEKQYQIIDFYTTLKYDLLTVNFQSTDEFKYNKELIYFNKLNLRKGGN